MGKIVINRKVNSPIMVANSETVLNDLSLIEHIVFKYNFVENLDADYKSKLIDSELKFTLDETDNELYSITTYSTNVELTDEELNDLGEYTQGQWSDGIGEGFEQESCMELEDGSEILLSPWFHGQELIITQTP